MLLPDAIYTAAQIRQIEAAVVAGGTPAYTLMQRAGAAAFGALRQRWPLARSVAVVAGPGNNGGDGLVLARLARQAGLAVEVLLVADAAALRGEARQAHHDLLEAGLQPLGFAASALAGADVVVDALLGIGVRAPLREEWVRVIAALNACQRPVFALDVPSGLDPDQGRALPAVHATATISFLGLKQGLFVGAGPEHAGEILFDALRVEGAPDAGPPVLLRLTHEDLTRVLPQRPRQSHKGQFGRVLIVGGGTGMPGAVRLAAEAALRVGAGLVTVASLPEHLAVVVGPRPELMFHAVREAADVQPVAAVADVIALGPGLGRDGWAKGVLAAVLAARRPGQRLVVDADALNLIAAGHGPARMDDWVLTPHPGEAARLLGTGIADIQADRLAALHALCGKRGGTVVLKGATSLVGRQGEVPRLCDRGNPGMSVPGMGDVLTGAIAGLLAQSHDVLDAVGAAVYAHAVAGDRCARQGVRGVLATEVAQELRAVLAQLP
ncbi:MAG TPA: NAD(P)H-hydrate dehydratase [Steroidobacteraceae bacterium]|nr:NAD(P)H-hydrate dehydratase [Steroidobacteraceae bacterium]